MNDINKFHANLPDEQYYELGNLMDENPDTSALMLLNWRIRALVDENIAFKRELDNRDTMDIHSCNKDCQKPVCKLRHERDNAIEALEDIEAIYLEGSDDRGDKNAMGTIAKNFLFYRDAKSPDAGATE